MKPFFVIAAIILIGGTLASFEGASPKSRQQLQADSLTADRKKMIDGLLASMKGQESKYADSVFKNEQVLGHIKVTHFLGVMDYWGEALGVSCNYCHNTNDWASDELHTKVVARGMYTMRQSINTQILSLTSQAARVNCTTCHKGNTKPSD
jgi:hypothetical protein